MHARTNWAGNVEFAAARVHRPASVDELRRIVAAGHRVRALGAGHSFSRVADTAGELVSTAGLPAAVEVDPQRCRVTVGGGVRYTELAGELHRHGLALANLGSLPDLTVAGACATGTHGSGDRNGSLATAVSGLELVTGTGDLVTLDRADADLAGAVVSLGCLGVVTRLTLDLVPAFALRQYVYQGLPRELLDAHLPEVLGSAYSVSVFTDWRGGPIGHVWQKRLVDPAVPDPPVEWLGARLADGPRHPVPDRSTGNWTPQLGVPGPWHERLPHFRLEPAPDAGDELQSEFFVPRGRAVEALAALDGVADRIAPVLLTSEIRSVAADGLWLSPAYGRDTVAVHFTWVRDAAAVLPVVAAVQEALAPFDPRPHWGKLFGTLPAGAYPRLPDFRRLADRYDPTGTFRNDATDEWLGRAG